MYIYVVIIDDLTLTNWNIGMNLTDFLNIDLDLFNYSISQCAMEMIVVLCVQCIAFAFTRTYVHV